MSIIDNARNGLINFLFPGLNDVTNQRVMDMQTRRDYIEGRQRPQLKVRPGKTDDNTYLNFSGLVIDRSISMLFGGGIEFDLPGEGDDTPEDIFINDTWEANKKEILLHRLGLLAGGSGTGYIKIIPNGVMGKLDIPRSRLVLVDPKWVEMKTNPEDFEEVIRYTIRFDTVGPDGKEVARKQIHSIVDPPVDKNGVYDNSETTWLIEDYMASSATGGRWELMDSEVWPYVFPQILHFQNLPSADDIYGEPDLPDDLIRLQNKINFNVSNENKILRLFAHPERIGFGIGTGSKTEDLGPGKILTVSDKDGFIKNIEMQSDMTASSEFIKMLRQTFFDVARTVDIDSIADKLGALTNFGLRVLFMDALNKIHTKQRLYGDALLELNKRLLIIAGMNNDPGKIIWPDPLPTNGIDLSKELKTDLEIGILDKQTATGLKGYDYQQVSDRLAEQETQNGDITDALIRAFERGE